MTRTHTRRALALALSLTLGAGLVVATGPTAVAIPLEPTLSSLTTSIGDLDATFDPAVTNYAMTVANTATYFSFTPTAGDPSATITTWNGDAEAVTPSGTPTTPSWLRVGANIMTATVAVPGGGPSVQYTLTVTKLPAPPPAYDLSLSSLAVSQGSLSPAFDSATTSYSVDVPYETTTLDFMLGSVPAGNGLTLSATMPVDAMTVRLAASGTLAWITVTAPDSTSRTYWVTITRGPAPTADVDLANLELSVGTLTPAFDPSITNYTATVPYAVRSMQITATASTSGHTLTLLNTPMTDGAPTTVPLNFDPMGNGFGINVTAANGVSKGYNVTITRDQPSSNANLTSLSLSNAALSPAFSNAETDYAVTVPYLTTSTTVTAVAADATAILRINGTDTASGVASSPIALRIGANSIVVEPTAEDGVTTTRRTIVVTREAPDLDLASLTVAGGTLSPAFDAATTAYTLALPYPVTSVDVAATSVESDWTLRIQGVETGASTIATPIGASTITVRVTALHGEFRDYTIAVTREAPSTNAILSGISLSGGTLAPSFSTGVHNYAASVGYLTKEITIGAGVADATASVTINGTAATSATLALGVGANTVTIVTTAQDGITTSTTTVVITRQAAPLPDVDIALGFTAGDAAAGAPFTINGANLLPGSAATVTMHSTPVVLARGTVLADGTIVLSARIPAGAGAGAHRLVFEGTAVDGTAVTSTAWFTVLANGRIGAVSLTGPVAYAEPAAVRALPVTGADAAAPAIVGTAGVAFGALLLMLGGALRRRARA
ncbi:cadherin-like beta sandwich domain-containing protein [Homoserinimonas hongtaonis]|uniref:cadherin-like beta sandwich domain-containing protein n=1 Tax=Homoserinimonas hongtaonis TaxID=2079791 RepID=UPI000D3739C8|nr:cadherin-like beta sandwich domain-containing protein [Salinibacterium hongtaonis]AWB90148.1 hypothetical protein C2138_11880 [Salinibacterium hongtaonis]